MGDRRTNKAGDDGVVIHWYRRDLRVFDNVALGEACRASGEAGVVPVFVFDPAILKHPDCGGAIVQFMLGCLRELRGRLRKEGGDLVVVYGDPVQEIPRLARKVGAKGVFFNRDYAPGAIERDEKVTKVLEKMGVEVRSFKDQVIFEGGEILAASTGRPYTVFGAYKKAWRKRWEEGRVRPVKVGLRVAKGLAGLSSIEMPTVESLGFTPLPGMEIEAGEVAGRRMLERFCNKGIGQYKETRNFPAVVGGTSRLSAHLRHGTVSIRECLERAEGVLGRESLPLTPALFRKGRGGKKPSPQGPSPCPLPRVRGRGFKEADLARGGEEGVEAWVDELIWREFYQQILFHFPRVEREAFKGKFAELPWKRPGEEWEAWKEGRTGFPIVDAGMRQLNATGWMHNRLRMIVAMFLVKDLGINWQLGERYFMQRLIDGETAQNNGGWQWVASTGTDSQPYFRIFNPASQSEACDPKGEFIRRYCPELKDVPDAFIHEPGRMSEGMQREIGCRIGVEYPAAIVDHAEARERTLGIYRKAAGISS